jgi:hypothetical protein
MDGGLGGQPALKALEVSPHRLHLQMKRVNGILEFILGGRCPLTSGYLQLHGLENRSDLVRGQLRFFEKI